MNDALKRFHDEIVRKQQLILEGVQGYFKAKMYQYVSLF